MDNANEAIFVAQDGMLRFVNPRSLELLGYSEEELTSRPFADFIHPLDRDVVLDRHMCRIKGERSPEVYSFRTLDNLENIRWVEIHAVAIEWERRPATLNFLVDITEKRRIGEELAKLEKLESLGMLAGGIAHDFNNFLTAILGNVALARMHSKSPEKLLERLSEAEKACLQAQGLTQQLLTFSKGGAPIKKSESIARLVEDSCKFALRGSNVAADFSLPENLLPVEVDSGQIGQVLNNLMINAAQAMPQGGLIAVCAQNCTVSYENGLPVEPGKYVQLQIKDQGIGIPENILPRIFDPYFTTKQRGSGLGLATAYSIIKNHGGFITAQSELGTGTTFTVYLPASEEKTEIAEAPKDTVAGFGSRILLMDDSEAIRDFSAEVLSTLGYEVFLASDGAEAVDLYTWLRNTTRPIDAVILDLTVPGGMGGLEAIRKLRGIDRNVRAIVSSGYSTDPIMANYREYGFRAVVAKPYTIAEFSDILSRVLTGADD